MATNQLTAVNGSGDQAATQSPQSASQPATGDTASSGVQPGTATSLLNGGQGSVQLHPSALSTVDLGGGAGAATGTVAGTAAKTATRHHVNPVLFGVSALLLVVAVVLFWTTSRSVKSTT